MKALIVSEPGRLELRDISAPKIAPHEALVRILGCGICGTTDAELVRGRQPFHRDYPAVLGHEAVGEVVEIGAKVTSFRIGDRVTRPVSIWPGSQRDGLASAWGGDAELGFVRDWRAMANDGDKSMAGDYTAVRQQAVPASLTTAEAILAISLSETASWFRYLPPVQGKIVCVSGTGIAGLGMMLWSLFAGAREVIALGRRPERLEVARKAGATKTLDVTAGDVPSRLRELNGGQGADFFLEAVGKSDQIELGFSCLAPGGTVAVYGVPEGQRYDITWNKFPWWGQLANYPAEEHIAYPWVARMLSGGHIPVDALMTHHWPLADYAEAFEGVRNGSVVKGWLDCTKA